MTDSLHDTSPSTLEQAFNLAPQDDALAAVVASDFSNAPSSQPPEKGFPFGGLMAALCARAMRQGLALDVPMRSLSVQYLSAAQYGHPVLFHSRMLRGGRRIAYTAVEAFQDGKSTHHATATFGADSATGHAFQDALQVPPSLSAMRDGGGMEGPFAPRFSNHVEFRFETGPNIFGGNAERPRVERAWMRMKDGSALDEMRLCYLLDALYPPSWTGFRKPPIMTTVDLRYDFISEATPDNTPDGWAFFEFALLDHGLGWAVDDAKAWAADGTLLATSRQRRKVLGAE